MENRCGNNLSNDLLSFEVCHKSSPSSSSSESNNVKYDASANPFLETKQVESFPSPPTQSPTAYPAGYDPNRIPAAVFASKPATTMEWSLASNESLFSIHVGNNSFSKDHFFMTYKSGELPNLDEMSSVSPGLHPVIESENSEQKSEDRGRTSDSKENVSADKGMQEIELSKTTTKQVSSVIVPNVAQDNMPPVEEVRNSSSSTHSFQFPVLGSDSFVKEEKQPPQKQLQQEPPPQPQPRPELEPESQPGPERQPDAPAPTPRAAGSGWFSCFPCCSLGRYRDHSG